MLDAGGDVLAIAQLAFAHPGCEPRHRFFVAVRVVEDQQAADPRALHQNVALEPWSGRPRVPAWDRSRTANHDARAERELRMDGVADRAGGVVEIHIHAIRRGMFERPSNVTGLVVDD